MNESYKFDLTVIVPVYNGAAVIERAITSILNEQKVSIEVICIDDGSNDGTWEKLVLLSQKYSTIQLVKQDHQGPALARNFGISNANSRYVAFVDADDYTTADFEKLINVSKHENADVVQFGYQQETPDGKILTTHKLPKYTYYNGKECFTYLYQQQYGHGCWAAIYRKDFLLEQRIFFPLNNQYEDACFFRKALMLSEKTVLLSEVYYHYIRYSSSRSNEWSLINLLNCCNMYQEHIDCLDIESKNFYIEDSICFIKTLRSSVDARCESILMKYLSSVLDGSKSVIVYGTGSSGVLLMSLLKCLKLESYYFCDSNTVIFGEEKLNIPILPIDFLKDFNDAKIIIGSCFIYDIFSKLEENYLSERVVFPLNSGLMDIILSEGIKNEQ